MELLYILKAPHLNLSLRDWLFWLTYFTTFLSITMKILLQIPVIDCHPYQTYRIQLWDMASASNIQILEYFQLKALCIIVNAPWYVPNMVIRRDLQTPTVKEEIRSYSSQYSASLSAHPNGLVVNLMELPDNRWLQRHMPNDLPTGFLM
jgi:hypothetical protein